MVRNAYLKKMEEKLEDWGREIDRIKARADKVESDLKDRYREQIEILREKQAAAVKSLREVKEAGASGWGKMKAGVDRTFDDLKKALEDAIAKLKKSA